PLANIRPAQAVDRTVHVDVFPARKVRVEAGPKPQERADVAGDFQAAARRLEDPGDQTEGRRLARAVPAAGHNRLAGLDRERDIAQRPDFLALKVAPPQDRLLERDVPLGVHLEPAADALGDNGSGLHASEGTARVSRTSAANACRKAGSSFS